MSAERLYQLLPGIHRARDAGAGQTLRALLAILDAELDIIRREIESGYDDLFVETARGEALERIREALGVRPLRDTGASGFRARGWVSNAVGWRRRKGTTGSLAPIARQVSGYDAWVIEHARELSTAASVRREQWSLGTADVRRASARQPSPLGGLPLTPDTHTPDGFVPRPNLPNVSVLLWRTQRWALARAACRSMGLGGLDAFRFDPLGADLALFAPASDTGEGRDVELLPLPLLRREEDAVLRGGGLLTFGLRVVGRIGDVVTERVLYDPTLPTPLPAGVNLHVCHLGEIDTSPPLVGPDDVHVDPELGRVLLGANWLAGLDMPAVLLDAPVARVAEVGAGPWNRQMDVLGWLGDGPITFQIEVRADAADPLVDDDAPRSVVRDLQRAVSRYHSLVAPGVADTVEVGDARLTLRVDSLVRANDLPSGSEAREGWPVIITCIATGISETAFVELEDPDGAGPGPARNVVRTTGMLGQSTASTNPTDYAVRVRHTGLILLGDSRDHAAPPDAIEVPVGCRVAVVGGTWPRDAAPTGDLGDGYVRGRFAAAGVMPRVDGHLRFRPLGALEDGASDGALVDGLLLRGGVRVLPGWLNGLRVSSSTVHDVGGVRVNTGSGNNSALRLEIERSIVSVVDVPDEIGALHVRSSVVLTDIDAPKALVDLDGVTVLGITRGAVLEASECLLVGGVDAAQTQSGCIRFSWTPSTATPPRFRCQPDLALVGVTTAKQQSVRDRVRPVFMSLDPSSPALATLRPDAPREVATCAVDSGEPGAHHMLEHEARLANAAAVLEDHVRFGPSYGLYVLV